MKRKMSAVAAFLILSNVVWSQCPLEGHKPAFEFDVPSGVSVDSVFLVTDDWESNRMYVESMGKSRNMLKDIHNISLDWTYDILTEPFSGPDTADYQIISGLATGNCLLTPGDWLSFNWQVIIYCSGVSGSNLNYTGFFPDDLNDPVHIGSVFDGINIVSGTIDNTLAGGIWLYPDGDWDGYGSMADSVLRCSIFCPFYRTNSLDCDDTNPDINPDAEEIPNNGIDENCDGSDLVTSIYAPEHFQIDIYPNPATDVINIIPRGQISFRASLFDVNGKRLYSDLNPQTIPVDWLAQGHYLLEIEDLDSGARMIERVVKGN